MPNPGHHRTHSDIDSALDSLGFSYLQDIQVVLNPRFQCPVNLDDVTELLNQPTPSLEGVAQWSYDGSLEREVMRSLGKMEEEAKAKEEKERLELEAYEVRMSTT